MFSIKETARSKLKPREELERLGAEFAHRHGTRPNGRHQCYDSNINGHTPFKAASKVKGKVQANGRPQPTTGHKRKSTAKSSGQ